MNSSKVLKKRHGFCATTFMGRIKHNHYLRETLGISQEEMSILLKINPSQIAMYESGKRELPVTAYIKLLKMSQYVEKMMTKMPEHHDMENENEKIAALIENELERINYDQIKYTRKLEQIKEKYRKALANCHLTDYLEAQPEEEKPSESDIAFYRQLGNRKIEKYGHAAQAPLLFKQETLKWQYNYLQEELKKIRK